MNHWLFSGKGSPPPFKLLSEEEREKLTRLSIIFGMMNDVDPKIVRDYAKLLIKEKRDRTRASKNADIQNDFRLAVGWNEYPRAKNRLLSELRLNGFVQ